MVAAHHLIWTIYGVWLPNDPRGSGSTEIRSRFLDELGAIHHGRKRIQPSGAILCKFYKEAIPLLKYDIVPLAEDEIATVAETFTATIKSRGYTCYACAIMPDHVHILIRKHRDKSEDMIAAFQDSSWEKVIETKNRPSDHPVWGGPGWKVYLDSCKDIERTIRYIREKPIKALRPEQTWEFVMKYDGWLPGIGATKK